MTEIETIKIERKEKKNYFNKRLNNKLRDTDVYTFLSHMHTHTEGVNSFLFLTKNKKNKRDFYIHKYT